MAECPGRLVLCGVPCGCKGENPSHRPPTEGTPMGLAYLDLLRAKERVAFKDTPTHRAQVADAMATLDALLDTYPHSSSTPTLGVEPTPTPDGPGAHTPGPSVSLAVELLDMGGPHGPWCNGSLPDGCSCQGEYREGGSSAKGS